jgi:hypothetical protein
MQGSPPNEIHSRGTFNKHRDTYKLISNGKLSRSNKTVRIMFYSVHLTLSGIQTHNVSAHIQTKCPFCILE